MRETEEFSFGLVGMVLDIIAAGLSSPVGIGRALKENWGHTASRSRINQVLSATYRRGYLNRYGQTGTYHYQLSSKGEQRLAQLNFRRIKFNPQDWDGQWRILTFDIPEAKRAQRDMVRHLIQRLGMRQLQKSVWLTPVDCRNQFEELKQAYGISGNDLLLLEVKNTPVLEAQKVHWW
jgi:phenylacetic acid degradation operon negative regulatory protein